MISLTIFENLYDVATEKRMDFENWEQFENLLYNLSKVPYKTKKQAKLISPATYEPGKTRLNDTVVDWGGWAALDIDSHDFKGNLKEELHDKYGSYYYVCYSTASSKRDYPKFRLVFKLKKRIKSSEIKKFWFALNKEFNELGDAQTKDLSRMYYVPGTYDNAYNFIFSNEGSELDPDALIKKHPMPEKPSSSLYDHLPPEMRDMVIKYKKEQLNNTDITWSNYKDCPFVNKKMLDDYLSIAFIDGSGRYSAFYQLMVSVAARAIKMGYPITENEIIEIVREIDMDTTNRYKKRRLDVEAKRALEFAMSGL